MINVAAVEAYREEYDSPDYSIYGRVREVGGLHVYMPILSAVLTLVFGLICLLAWRSDEATERHRD